MSTQHTPGPWRMSRRMCPQSGEGFYWVSAERTLHLQVAPCPDGFVFGENEANARLIAAAPDLLAACEAALEWACETGRFADGRDTTAALAEIVAPALEAAIAKARGVQS